MKGVVISTHLEEYVYFILHIMKYIMKYEVNFTPNFETNSQRASLTKDLSKAPIAAKGPSTWSVFGCFWISPMEAWFIASCSLETIWHQSPFSIHCSYHLQSTLDIGQYIGWHVFAEKTFSPGHQLFGQGFDPNHGDDSSGIRIVEVPGPLCSS